MKCWRQWIVVIALYPAICVAREPDATLCDDVKDLPLIQEINREIPGVEQKATALQGAIDTLKTKCQAYQADAKQIGPVVGEFNAAAKDVPPKNQAYKSAVTSYLEKMGTAREGMQKLAHKSCVESLGKARQTEETRRQTLEAAAKAACSKISPNDLDSRLVKSGRANSDQASRVENVAEVAGASGSGSKMSAKEMESALLQRNDPQSRKNSAALLDQAEKFAKENGLPSPRTNSRDTVCGESCVAMLRAQTAQATYGKESWQYESLASEARSTKRGRFGSKR